MEHFAKEGNSSKTMKDHRVAEMELKRRYFGSKTESSQSLRYPPLQNTLPLPLSLWSPDRSSLHLSKSSQFLQDFHFNGALGNHSTLNEPLNSTSPASVHYSTCTLIRYISGLLLKSLTWTCVISLSGIWSSRSKKWFSALLLNSL